MTRLNGAVVAAIAAAMLKLRSYFGHNVMDEKILVDSVLEADVVAGWAFLDKVQQVEMASESLADVITLNPPIHLSGTAGKNLKTVYHELQKHGARLKGHWVFFWGKIAH